MIRITIVILLLSKINIRLTDKLLNFTIASETVLLKLSFY